jgi:hypothetical protein
MRGEAGEQLLEHRTATRVQAVQMASLRHTAAVSPDLWHGVPVDNRDLPVGIGEHSGRQQPGHARTQNNRMISQLLPHREPHFLSGVP